MSKYKVSGPFARCFHCGYAMRLGKRYGQKDATWWHIHPGEAKCGVPEVEPRMDYPIFHVIEGGRP